MLYTFFLLEYFIFFLFYLFNLCFFLSAFCCNLVYHLIFLFSPLLFSILNHSFHFVLFLLKSECAFLLHDLFISILLHFFLYCPVSYFFFTVLCPIFSLLSCVLCFLYCLVSYFFFTVLCPMFSLLSCVLFFLYCPVSYFFFTDLCPIFSV